ncbi:MAG: NADH-quinone oxidoreductase subunit J [Acidobacteria bacterium]|nr:NADH-quinone oxidoreductase subunit J [Acidobacteriota bacterium]
MDFVQILFLGLAALAVVAAFNMILQRNPIYSAIGLIVVLCSLAALFLLLYAQFIAAVQIIVYAGAIMVLFVFVIMLLNVREEESKTDRLKYLKWLAAPLFLALLGEVFVVIRYVNDAPAPIPSTNTLTDPSQSLGTVESIANGMFTTYVLPFEAVSVLILMAIVGSMLLARREKKEDIDRMEQALMVEQDELQEAHQSVEKSKEEVAA